MRPINRAAPVLPAHAMKTYTLLAPLPTHWRPATCAEVECRASQRGWRTTVDVSTDLGARQANYIRLHSGRSFTVDEVGTLVTFAFPAGQACFATHQVPLERDPIHLVTGGDWRGNPRGDRYRHVRPQDWQEDFANHQDRLATRLSQG